MTESAAQHRSFFQTVNENRIPALILLVGTVSLIWGAATFIFWKQMESATTNFAHAMARMDALFKDTGSTSTNVLHLREDLRTLRDDIRSVRDDIRDDVRNLREDSKIIADEVRKVRDIQSSREAAIQTLREGIINVASASREVIAETTSLRNELRAAKPIEVQIVESYGVRVDEQLLVNFEKGNITVSPLTSDKTRQIADAQFNPLPGSKTSTRTWWSLPSRTSSTDITSSISKPKQK